MICSNCGHNTAYIYNATQTFSKGNKFAVIEGIPVEMCRNCDIELFADDTAQRLDKLLKQLLSSNEPTVIIASFQHGSITVQASIAENQTETSPQPLYHLALFNMPATPFYEKGLSRSLRTQRVNTHPDPIMLQGLSYPIHSSLNSVKVPASRKGIF